MMTLMIMMMMLITVGNVATAFVAKSIRKTVLHPDIVILYDKLK